MDLTGFDIVEELGRGGMATVWKARQLSLDRIVAIKVLDTEWAADHDDVVRFQEEARAAARLKHGGIVQVYDFNVEDDVYYFVMEFVAGYTVGDWLRRKGKLAQKNALLVADSVSAALHYAWENAGIVHCDIKPDNVMIDADGTVKVADLGLARTIQVMRGASKARDEIMGTPQYISPEQAAGVADLDCRADIYSLGAMLYHMVTGTMLFEGEGEENIIDMQMSDTVKDALDLNPKLSRPMCWLLEKMLMKDRDLRQSDWQAVREDIQLVRKGRMPAGCKKLAKGASTMRRSRHRVHHDPVRPADMRPRKRTGSSQGSPVGKIVGFAVAAVFVIVLGLILHSSSKQSNGGGNRGTGNRPVGRNVPSKGEQLLKRAQQWAAAHPEQYAEAIQHFQHVIRNARGTPFAGQAQREIGRIETRRDAHVSRVMAELRASVGSLADSNRFDDAIALCRAYSGPVADETGDMRRGMIEGFERRRDALEAERAAERERLSQRVAQARDRLYDALLNEGIAVAREQVLESLADPELTGVCEELNEVEDALIAAQDERKRVLRAFGALIGKTTTVEFKEEGKVLCKIVGMEGLRVEAEEDLGAGGAMRPFRFTLDDVAPREMLKRMGTTNTPPVALVKGIMAYEAKSWTHTRRYFESCAPVLRSNLIARVDVQERGAREAMAETDLMRLMVGCGAQVAGFDEAQWLTAVDRMVIMFDKVAAVERSLAAYKQSYEGSVFLERAATVIAAFEEMLADTREEGLRRERERATGTPDVPGVGDGATDSGGRGMQPFTDEDYFSL